MKKFVSRLVTGVLVACAIWIAALAPATAQSSTDFCTAASESFTCGKETCITACMTPDEWELCADKRWYANSYDHKVSAPQGATAGNRIRFFERCGTVCRPMGSPRLAYRTHGGTLKNGTVIAPRWVPFAFSPPRQ